MYKRIQKKCKEKGISINQLEKELKFARGSIYKWDKNKPSIDKVKALADFLKTPIEYFVK